MGRTKKNKNSSGSSSRRRRKDSTQSQDGKETTDRHHQQRPTTSTSIRPETIKGSDDVGNFYGSHEELEIVQERNKVEWYAANDKYWIDCGYGGMTDDECMVGDTGGVEDGEEGLDFLDRLLLSSNNGNTGNNKNHQRTAIDAGAGVGRITKYILLRRYESVSLIEADPALSKRSRTYLGKKKAGRCTFTCSRLEDLNMDTYSFDSSSNGPGNGGRSGGAVDLIWLQWTLQYLTDADVVRTLKKLAKMLMTGTGILVVKENRPYGSARTDRFQMDTPICNGRYDITRSDNHHRFLFERSGLQVDHTEQGEETNTYAVSSSSSSSSST